MPSDVPTHIGTLDRSDVVETPDGMALLIETDQGGFLIDASEKVVLNALIADIEHYGGCVVVGETDG